MWSSVGGENSAFPGLMRSFQPPLNKGGGQAEREAAGFWLRIGNEGSGLHIRRKTSLSLFSNILFLYILLQIKSNNLPECMFWDINVKSFHQHQSYYREKALYIYLAFCKFSSGRIINIGFSSELHSDDTSRLARTWNRDFSMHTSCLRYFYLTFFSSFSWTPTSHFLVIFLSTLSVHFVIDSVAHNLSPPASSNHSHTIKARLCVFVSPIVTIFSFLLFPVRILCHTAVCSAPHVSILFLFSVYPFSVFHFIHLKFLFSHCHYHQHSNFVASCFSFFVCLCSFISFLALLCSSLTVQASRYSPIHLLLLFLFTHASLLGGEGILFSNSLFQHTLLFYPSSAIIPGFLNSFVACLSLPEYLFFHLISSFVFAPSSHVSSLLSHHHPLSVLSSLPLPFSIFLLPLFSLFETISVMFPSLHHYPPKFPNFFSICSLSSSFLLISFHLPASSTLFLPHPLIFSLHLYIPMQGFWKRK